MTIDDSKVSLSNSNIKEYTFFSSFNGNIGRILSHYPVTNIQNIGFQTLVEHSSNIVR